MGTCCSRALPKPVTLATFTDRHTLQSPKTVYGTGGVYRASYRCVLAALSLQKHLESQTGNVVLKVCDSCETKRARMVFTAAASQPTATWCPLPHPVLQQPVQVNPSANVVFFECLPQTLHSLVWRSPHVTLGLPTIAAMWKQLVQGLHAIHVHCNYLHMDICPENVGVRDDMSVAILDYGEMYWLGHRSAPATTRFVYSSMSQHQVAIRDEDAFGYDPDATEPTHAMVDYDTLLYCMLHCVQRLVANAGEATSLWKPAPRGADARALNEHVLHQKQALPLVLQHPDKDSWVQRLPDGVRAWLLRIHTLQARMWVQCAPQRPIPDADLEHLLQVIDEGALFEGV